MTRPTRHRRPADPHAASTAWRREITESRLAPDPGDRWRKLERAHILSQPFPVLHARTHLAMLRHGIQHRDLREIRGQLIRLALAAPGSLTGRYPLGNTGGANVSALAPMPVPDDLAEVLSP